VLHGLLFYAPDLHQRYARVSLGLDQNNRSVPLAGAAIAEAASARCAHRRRQAEGEGEARGGQQGRARVPSAAGSAPLLPPGHASAGWIPRHGTAYVSSSGV
jgi:hypothetical protein